MNENPETDIVPTTSTSDKDDDLSTLSKASDEEIHDAQPHVTENEGDIENIQAPKVVQKNDSKLEEIKIVSVSSAVLDESINKIKNDEQEVDSESMKSINNSTLSEPESAQVKLSDDRNETRMISLDTIIRKGLNEQMPMTAKDIDNIVPNAIKQQQDADLKQSEKLANEKEFSLVYESSDDYNSSNDDKFDDELVEDDNVQQQNEEETVKEIETSKNDDAMIVDNENENDNESENNSAQLICEAVLEDKTCSDTAGVDSSGKGVTDTQMNESNDSTTSEHSLDDFDSGSDSTHSSHKKQKRRKSTAIQNKIKDDSSKKSDETGEIDDTVEIGETSEIGEDTPNEPGPRLNRRGKPRKSYDETDSEQLKKKVGRKLKIQRYSGPKRPGVRVIQ